MKTPKADCKDTVLINYPTEVMVSEVEAALQLNTPATKKLLLKVIFHRLHNRYVRPLNNIQPTTRRSGFLIMAAGCLVIEAYQSFREGREYTRDKGAGKKCFQNFFENNQAFSLLSPCFEGFYYNIRCGILHQAETFEDWKIIRQPGAPLFDPARKAIQADIFLTELTKSIRDYCRYLSKVDWSDPLWEHARFKLKKICEHHK